MVLGSVAPKLASILLENSFGFRANDGESLEDYPSVPQPISHRIQRRGAHLVEIASLLSRGFTMVGWGNFIHQSEFCSATSYGN